VSLVKIVKFNIHSDKRGSLVSIESKTSVPFNIKRIYYIHNIQTGVSRGFHAHKKLNQVMIAISGKCRVILDNGIKREEIWIQSPDQGLLIKNMIWREMYDFSKECILLVLASQKYDKYDYIRDYKKFLQLINKLNR
jgi:dTDP-4-dehydrorhamnose 3,5-epimerase-like enzyme